jgi:predicted alpha/beta-fold hydrolase
MTPEGGHCAFMERPRPTGDERYDGYWAEREIVRFSEIYRGET